MSSISLAVLTWKQNFNTWLPFEKPFFLGQFYFQLFPDSLEIRGRIPFQTVWDYFDKLKTAGSTELSILRFHVAHEEDKGLYANLFNYFSSRNRIGVVGFDKPLVKDFYILPLPSHRQVPENILPFEGPGKKSWNPHSCVWLPFCLVLSGTRVIKHFQVVPRRQSLTSAFTLSHFSTLHKRIN